jgi:hypothetical protein
MRLASFRDIESPSQCHFLDAAIDFPLDKNRQKLGQYLIDPESARSIAVSAWLGVSEKNDFLSGGEAHADRGKPPGRSHRFSVSVDCEVRRISAT